MTSISRLSKDVIALLVVVGFTVLSVAWLGGHYENQFAALLVLAVLMPVIASAAVSVKRSVGSSWRDFTSH